VLLALLLPLWRTADGLGPLPVGVDDGPLGVGPEVEPEGVGDGGEVEGGGVVGGALLGGGAVPPRIVSTVPPGENVTWLVHCPAGAADVAVAVMTTDWPAPKVPEVWLSAIHESCAFADQGMDTGPVLRRRIEMVFGSPERWLTLTWKSAGLTPGGTDAEPAPPAGLCPVLAERDTAGEPTDDGWA
jgi:hypothetical protein